MCTFSLVARTFAFLAFLTFFSWRPDSLNRAHRGREFKRSLRLPDDPNHRSTDASARVSFHQWEKERGFCSDYAEQSTPTSTSLRRTHLIDRLKNASPTLMPG